MNEIITLTRKDLKLLLLDKTSLIVTFALPLILVALIGTIFASTFPMQSGITSYDYAFSKVMFWGLIGGAASSVGSIAVEKYSGTMVRLQLSPINKFQLLSGKVLACITTLMVSSLISWLFASLLFDIRTNSILLLLLIFFSNAVLFSGLMTLLAHFAKTERAAGALSWTVFQVLACFSGVMFPVAMMPSWMVTITDLNPLTWGVKAMELALWKEAPITEVILPIAIPLLTGILLFTASGFMFRWTSEK